SDTTRREAKRRERVFTTEILDPARLAGKRVTVMGLGLFGGGRGAVEFLCRHGATVTVTDLRSEEELAPTLHALAHLPFERVLGEHRERDFTDAHLVIASPAVPRSSSWLERARQAGVPLETEMNL